ncbi:hypothetical protein [Veronia pacifica]|nr:hypothetical protein [Veronia pacifica]
MKATMNKVRPWLWFICLWAGGVITVSTIGYAFKWFVGFMMYG